MNEYFDGLAKDCGNSGALTMKFCAKPSICLVKESKCTDPIIAFLETAKDMDFQKKQVNQAWKHAADEIMGLLSKVRNEGDDCELHNDYLF